MVGASCGNVFGILEMKIHVVRSLEMKIEHSLCCQELRDENTSYYQKLGDENNLH